MEEKILSFDKSFLIHVYTYLLALLFTFRHANLTCFLLPHSRSYLYYTYPKFGNCDEGIEDSGPVNRLSRWTWNEDLNKIDPDSEVVLLDTPKAIEAMHNSGKIEFGKDGMLYVTIGDQGSKERAQELNSVTGGIVRLTDEGDIPADNPFANDVDGVRCNKTGRGNGKCKELYAVGLRNPFRFSMNPNTKGGKVHFFVNDVGGSKWEEINESGDDFVNNSIFDYNLGIQNFGLYKGIHAYHSSHADILTHALHRLLLRMART